MKRPNTLMIIGFIGLLGAGAGLIFDTLYPSQIDFVSPPDAAAYTSDTNPNHISIPDLGIDLAIEPGIIDNNNWSVSNTNANHLTSSAKPGDNGNIIMYGHDDRSIFGPLKQAEIGQVVTIKDSLGTFHTYEVQYISTVSPNDASVIAPTDSEILTIYTCTGFANSKRLVVRAIPVDL